MIETKTADNINCTKNKREQKIYLKHEKILEIQNNFKSYYKDYLMKFKHTWGQDIIYNSQKYKFINSKTLLIQMMFKIENYLSKQTFQTITIDVEAGIKSNGPSLIQIGTLDQDYLIDCYKIDWYDLPLLNKLTLNASIEKVLFCCAGDIRWLLSTGIYLVNIFDVQLAVMEIENLKNCISFKKVVYEYLNINLDKELQQSDWNKRPLDEKQLKYAQDDIKYLSLLTPKIKSKMSLDNFLTVAENSSKILAKMSDYKNHFKYIKFRSKFYPTGDPTKGYSKRILSKVERSSPKSFSKSSSDKIVCSSSKSKLNLSYKKLLMLMFIILFIISILNCSVFVNILILILFKSLFYI